MKNKVTLLLSGALLLGASLILISCKKDWLDAKTKKSLVVPSTVKDYQAILDKSDDNSGPMFNVYAPSMGEESADGYYLNYETWSAIDYAPDKNAYVWSNDIFQGQPSGDWNYAYSRILNANVVIEGIEKVSRDNINKGDWDNVKGSALYFRAFDYYNLCQLFCKPYTATTAGADLGLPLKLKPDVNEKSKRATLQQTYDQVIEDLILAKELLPVKPLYKTRPSRPAALALIARIYLSMEDYPKAKLYADSCLQLHNVVLDYNTVDTSLLTPFGNFNPEVIFHSSLAGAAALAPTRAIVAPSLLNSYEQNDLRRTLMFKFLGDQIRFFGSYAEYYNFNGLATDEIYLIRAECLARAGNTSAAMADLNSLLKQRWITGSFIPKTASDALSALKQILLERRKELYFRGLRWSDLRRLNKDSRFAITLERNLNGQVYKLLPNDPKYVLPIPPDEIRLSGIEQNPR